MREEDWREKGSVEEGMAKERGMRGKTEAGKRRDRWEEEGEGEEVKEGRQEVKLSPQR